MATLSNKEFLQVLKSCCKDGKIDDEKMNEILGAYFPYNLTFGDKRWDALYVME